MIDIKSYRDKIYKLLKEIGEQVGHFVIEITNLITIISRNTNILVE